MAAKQATKGVFLLSIGKRGYAFAAYNMAKSIKSFNPNVQIAVLHDSNFDYLGDKSVFDVLIRMPEMDKNDPGKAKTLLWDYSPFDETLYLDVDGLALKDVEPLMNELSAKPGYFYCIKMGEGGIADNISYNMWAKNEDVWKVFELKETYTTVQTSVLWFRKKESKKFFEKLKLNFNNGFPNATLWGGTLPDELFYSGTISQMGIDPDMGRPIFFGNDYDKRGFTQLEQDYYILSMFGNGTGSTLTKLKYIEWYDRLVNRFKGYKAQYIMRDKHLNRK